MAKTNTLDRFRITPTNKLDFADLGSFPTRLRALSDKESDKLLKPECERMFVNQEMLYASKTNSLLVVIQALDAAGKDSAVKHGLSGLNVVGTRAVSFKAPTKAELKEDFLDRHTRALPQLGEVGIWVRSHYEEVAVVRVHPEYLKGRGIDPASANQKFWEKRINKIKTWEDECVQKGISIVKLFINASPQVRIERLIARTENPAKYWKVNAGDVEEIRHLPEYSHAFEEAINKTSSSMAPWYIVPGDDKDETHVLVAQIVNYEMERLSLHYPRYTGAALKEIEDSRRELKAELARLRK